MAILRKLKEHLLSQRNKFYDYLTLLEQEEIDLTEGDFVKLNIHTEMEKEVLDGIYAFQKVIDPLEDMYRSLTSSSDTLQAELGLPDLRNTIVSLKDQVQQRNRHNRQLLSECMEELKTEILAIRRPFQKTSQFVPAAPTLIDITT